MTDARRLEQRVMRSLVGLAVLLTSVCAGIALLIAYIAEDEIIDRLIRNEVNHLQQAYALDPVLPTPRVDYIRLYASEQQAPPVVAAALQQDPRGQEIFTPDERHFHVRYLYFSERHQPILVAEVSSLLVVTNMSSSLLRLLIGMLVVMVAIAFWLAYSIARRTTRPITQLSDEVRQRYESHETLSFAAAERDDEIGYLAETIQTTFNELQDALQRERHFTRDVSHELRTPLTIMNNSLSLIDQRPMTAEDHAELQQAVNHMQSTVMTLLALARAESLQVEQVALLSLVEDCVLSVHPALEAAGFQVSLTIASDIAIEGNRQLLSLLVNNLLENALQYSTTPSLRVTATADRLAFENSVTAPVIDNLTAPNQKQPDSQGIGQGLFLVSRIADALGWELATRVEAGTFSVTLIFQPDTSPQVTQ